MKSIDSYPFWYAQLCFITGCIIGAMSWLPSLANKINPSAPEFPFIPDLWIVGAAFGVWGILWMMVISVHNSTRRMCV
jgi:hypothetical protein